MREALPPWWRHLSSFRSDVYWWEPDGRVSRISPGDGIYFMACVHPDGDHTVFWGGSEHRPRLWIADGAGAVEAITDGRRSARYPAYSADGGTLAYSASSHPTEMVAHLSRRSTASGPHLRARMSIVVRGTDGREHDITDGRHQDQRPAISPDGTKIAFISDRLGRNGLWITRSDGLTTPSPLVIDRPVYRPWWSIDGQRIFFFTFGMRHQVHSVSALGGPPTPLANDDRGYSHGPYADPDGTHLLMHSTREARSIPNVWALFELPLDGGRPRRLMPPGHERGAHGTRARNGVVTFDVSRTS
jgi:TolB protein